MASGGRESNVFSSDDESLHPVEKRRRKPKAIVSSDSDDDSDFEVKPRRSVKPLDCESEDSIEDFNNDASYSSEPRFCSNTEEDFSALNDISDNEQSEKCAICLSKFSGQDIATPETCDHMFCLECLQEWAKNVNTCPIDRLKFNLILIRHHKEEKIFKRIFVNCPELPWLYESESESNIQTEISSCGFCGEHDNEDALLPCHECHKTFHVDCLLPPPIQLSASSRICPSCSTYIRVKRLKSSRRLDIHEANSLSSALGMTYSDSLAQNTSTTRGLWRLRQKTHELIQRFKRRRVISSSESSDEDIEHSNHSSVRLYQDQISSKSQCPFIQKRRREIYRSHNRTLISSTASATSNSELYSVDSDDGIGDMRYDSYDSVLVHHGHPSSTSRNFSSGQTRDKTIISECPSENFDVVGSILQSQTLLHRADVLTLKRDGTVLLNSDINSDSRLTSPSATSSIGSVEKSQEKTPNPYFKSSVFDNKSVLPYSGGVVYNQRPMNPSQNTNSKYRETPRENYSCSSSTTSTDPSTDYDNGNISSRNTLESSGNEKYNDNSCSSVIHKSFCGASATDDIKKVSSNFKESTKGHHSEDEVDIYSDIESVGDEEGVCNTIEGVNDRIEPMKLPYKGDESPSSNPGAGSDSSDNELVIDEDMAAEEENDNRKEIFQVNNSNDKSEVVENEQVNESEDSNVSYSEPYNQEHASSGTPDVQEENCSYVDSRSVEDSQLGEESSQETFQDSTCPEGYKNDAEYEEGKNESECDENKNGSDDEDKNESEEDNKNGSEDEDKNGSEDEDKNESEDEDKNESEAEGKNESETGEDKNGSECGDQESDMDVQLYEENSMDSLKKSPRAGTSTPCSTISSKHYDEEMKQESLEGHCENSISSENQEYCDAVSEAENEKDKGLVDISSMQVNENTSDSFSQAEDNENYNNENNSNLSFESVQNVMSEPEAMDSNVEASQTFSEGDKKEYNEVDMKSDHENEDVNENNDNVDFSENASTPCLDENIDGQIENSPIQNYTLGNTDNDFKSEPAETADFDQKSDRTSPSAGDYESGENDKINEPTSEEQLENNSEKVPENTVDLGIEDISEAGSGDLDDDFVDENMSFSENKKQTYNDAEQEDNSNFESNDVEDDQDSKTNAKHTTEDLNYQTSPHNSNQSFEDREEGEIIEDKPVSRSDRKHSSKFDCYHDENEDYAPRVNISDLPRIPKIKRDREKDCVPEEIPIETKRTSVLGRVDLGGGDISWKRLSKHTRERSYRDGRPKDDRVLYRERESRKKDKKFSNDNEWRNDSKSSRRDDSKKQDSEKLRSEYESRSRKSDKKDSKISDWNYSERDKRSKSHKDKHKDKHKEKKDKGKHDKKYSKEESKYGRDKIKDDDHYDRELRFDKEQRFERIVYEKGKFKEKEHKSKHKDRKNDSKSGKDHSREKHKHVHSSDHFSDKQREREVRKIDDKLKIVVEQKEGRKEKSKHKDKKDSKHDKKQIHHHEHRKKEVERSPYTELSSIESKEIFAKGDSIIINVNFNRTSSPKDLNADNTDNSFKDRKNIEEFELDEVVNANNDKNKGKHSIADKGKSVLDTSMSKRPVTPPERTNPVLSVSECYWQGGEDSDANNSPASEKSVEEVTGIEEENETMESADPFEGDNFSNSCNSVDVPESQTTAKEGVSGSEETLDKPDKIDNSFTKESENIVPPKRRSPRSPSPPSPADNDSYDPCEPTRSPSPPPMPPAPPLPAGNPKPPLPPELPPLPPEPEPIDNIREETLNHKQNSTSDYSVSVATVSSSSQPVTVNAQTSVAKPMSLSSILLPPPSFLSHTAATTNSLPTLSSLLPPRNFNFQVNNHTNVIFPPNHMQQVLQGIVPSQIHASGAIPPPPNPPSLPHMGSVPPPPPPPSAMALISQVRHPQMNVRPALPPNSLLQNLTMGHPVTMSMQMSHLHHIPPNLSNPLSSHQSPMLIPSQNQPVSLPVSIQNQPVSRIVLPQNQILNHSTSLQNQNNIGSKPQGNAILHQSLSNNTPQKSDKVAAAEKSEVVDMEVDSPYSPGDSPSMDSVCDYSPTSSPLPSSPKNKDIFDTLLPADHRTTDRKTQDSSTKAEKSKRSSESKSDIPSKKAKHEHKSDSGKVRHSVRMQIADKNKSRKEQKTEKKLDDSQLKILDDLPSSAVEMQVKEKFLKKLNRQERVVEEVKLALKPYYKSRDVNKEEYKDILRKSVPKICHNKSGEINPVKVKTLVECYIKKIKHSRKKADKKKSSKLS